VTFTIHAAIVLQIRDVFGATILALESTMVALLALTLALVRTTWIVILVSTIDNRVAFGVKAMVVEVANRLLMLMAV